MNYESESYRDKDGFLKERSVMLDAPTGETRYAIQGAMSLLAGRICDECWQDMHRSIARRVGRLVSKISPEWRARYNSWGARRDNRETLGMLERAADEAAACEVLADLIKVMCGGPAMPGQLGLGRIVARRHENRKELGLIALEEWERANPERAKRAAARLKRQRPPL